MLIVIFGLILTVSVGAFVGVMLTSSMKNRIAKVIVCIAIALAVGFGISGAIELEYLGDAKRWNNGVCSICGESFELFDIEHHRNSGNTYYYECENGHLIETANHFSN